MSELCVGGQDALPEELLKQDSQERHSKGTVIFKCGDTESAFFVIEGRVALLHASGMQVAMLGPGDFVGQSAFLHSDGVRFTARTITSATVIRLSRADMNVIRRENSARMLLARATSSFIKQLSDNIVMGGKSVRQRVAHWIASATDRNADSISVTHDEIAGFLSVRRPGVTGALHELEGDHLLLSQRGRVTVKDRAGLIAIASGHSNGVRSMPPSGLKRSEALLAVRAA